MPVAVDVTRSHTNGAVLGVLEGRAAERNILVAAPVPLEGLVGGSISSHDELKVAIAVSVSHCHAVV